jgi:hypothetical protein
MVFVEHFFLALGFALILAPYGDQIREMWRNSVFSGELTIFTRPCQAGTGNRKQRSAPGRRRPSRDFIDTHAPAFRSRRMAVSSSGATHVARHGKMRGMDEQKKLLVRGTPITVYKQEPTTATPAEWHEVWIAERPETGEWILCQRHGVWNEAEKKAYLDVPVLSAPFRTEEQAEAELDQQIRFLDGIGFIHKYTLVWDSKIMGMRGEKLR